jgi:hypothetical protein
MWQKLTKDTLMFDWSKFHPGAALRSKAPTAKVAEDSARYAKKNSVASENFLEQVCGLRGRILANPAFFLAQFEKKTV